MTQELKVLQDFQDLSSYLLHRILKFPRTLRWGLGLFIEQRLQLLLALLIRAKFAPPEAKEPLLRDANVELEILRFQLRQATEVKALPLSSQQHALERLTEVGRQVGGWLRALPSRLEPKG